MKGENSEALHIEMHVHTSNSILAVWEAEGPSSFVLQEGRASTRGNLFTHLTLTVYLKKGKEENWNS